MRVKGTILLTFGFMLSFISFLTVILIATGTIDLKDLKNALKTRDFKVLLKRGEDIGETEAQPKETSESNQDALHTSTQKDTSWIRREMKLIDQKKADLEKRELEIKAEEDRLESVKKEVEDLLQQSQSAEEQRITQLVRLYDSMQEDEVASIMENLSDSMIVQILSRMRVRQAAKVLSALQPTRAARITRLMAKVK